MTALPCPLFLLILNLYLNKFDLKTRKKLYKLRKELPWAFENVSFSLILIDQ